MRFIQTFDPTTATAGYIKIGAGDPGQKVLLYNESAETLHLDFQDGLNTYLHAFEANYWTLQYPLTQIAWTSVRTLTQAASSFVDVFLYDVGEPVEGTFPVQLNRQQVASNLLNTDVNTGNTVTTLASVLTTLESVLTNTGNSVTNLASVITNLESIITNTGSIITNTGGIITNTSGIITNTGSIITNTGNIATLAGQAATYVSTSNLVLNTTFTLTLPGTPGKTTYLMGFHLTSTALSNGTDYYEVILSGLAGISSDQFTATANPTQGAQLIVSYTPFGIPASGQNTTINIQCSHAAANASWYTIGAYGYQI